jgi:hypothetical protein
MTRHAPLPRVKLTLCLIARDEARFLPGCLASVRPWVDEMVVVDTGSTDGTVLLARAAGARVVDLPWTDDFAAARNASLEAATGDWVLVLDADELLADGSALRRAMADEALICGMLPLHNAARLDALPAEVVGGSARLGEPVALPRLFRRRPDLRFRGVIHESIGADLDALLRRGRRRAVRPVGAPIVHWGYAPDLGRSSEKGERNQRLLRLRVAQDPEDPIAWAYLAQEIHAAGGDARPAADAAVVALRHRRARGARVSVVPVLTVAAVAHLRAGDCSRALAILADGEAVAHPNLPALRGLACERLGRWGTARLHFREALGHAGAVLADPVIPAATGPNAAVRAAWCLVALGEDDLAAAEFATIAERWPGLHSARLGLATALAGRSPGRALSLVEPLLLREPDAWFVAALAANSAGRPRDAALFCGRAASRPADPALHVRAVSQLSLKCRTPPADQPIEPAVAGQPRESR